MAETVGKENMAPRGRVTAFDVLNILACLGVITLHHNGLVHTFDGSRAWAQSLVAECLWYWAVPVFMMISGANLMRYRQRYDTRSFFKKRALHTVLPWLFWSVVILSAKVWKGLIVLGPSPLLDAVNRILSFTQVEYVYWFFRALFACYLAMPVFSLLCDRRDILWYVVALNGIAFSVLPRLRTLTGLSISMDVALVGEMILFALLGYLLSTGLPAKKQRLLLYALGLCAVVIRYVFTYYRSFALADTATTLKGYQQMHSVFYAAAIFVLGLRIPWERVLGEKVCALLPRLSACSFGIFLIHRIVMYVEMPLLGLDGHSLVWRVLCPLLTYGVSLLITLVLKKLPILKYTVG